MPAMQRILVVDDEEKIRKIYRDLLSDSFEFFEAKNGEWAAGLLLQQEEMDLVLLDIHMPVVNGQPLFDLIKLYNPKAKIIVTSVDSLEDQRWMIKGADGYFNKLEGTDQLISK